MNSLDDLAEDDFRRGLPWWRPENLATNQALLDVVGDLAAKKSCTPGQVALAWVLAKGPDVVPIPGTKRSKYLLENLAAVEVQLTPVEIAELDALRPAGVRAALDRSDANRTTAARG